MWEAGRLVLSLGHYDKIEFKKEEIVHFICLFLLKEIVRVLFCLSPNHMRFTSEMA